MLKIEFEFKRGILFVRLIGELNKSTASKLKIIDDTIRKAGIKYLLINLEKTTIINNNELNNMVERYKMLIGKDGRLLICGYYSPLKLNIKQGELNKICLSEREISAFNIINI